MLQTRLDVESTVSEWKDVRKDCWTVVLKASNKILVFSVGDARFKFIDILNYYGIAHLISMEATTLKNCLSIVTMAISLQLLFTTWNNS